MKVKNIGVTGDRKQEPTLRFNGMKTIHYRFIPFLLLVFHLPHYTGPDLKIVKDKNSVSKFIEFLFKNS